MGAGQSYTLEQVNSGLSQAIDDRDFGRVDEIVATWPATGQAAVDYAVRSRNEPMVQYLVSRRGLTPSVRQYDVLPASMAARSASLAPYSSVRSLPVEDKIYTPQTILTSRASPRLTRRSSPTIAALERAGASTTPSCGCSKTAAYETPMTRTSPRTSPVLLSRTPTRTSPRSSLMTAYTTPLATRTSPRLAVSSVDDVMSPRYTSMESSARMSPRYAAQYGASRPASGTIMSSPRQSPVWVPQFEELPASPASSPPSPIRGTRLYSTSPRTPVLSASPLAPVGTLSLGQLSPFTSSTSSAASSPMASPVLAQTQLVQAQPAMASRMSPLASSQSGLTQAQPAMMGQTSGLMQSGLTQAQPAMATRVSPLASSQSALMGQTRLGTGTMPSLGALQSNSLAPAYSGMVGQGASSSMLGQPILGSRV